MGRYLSSSSSFQWRTVPAQQANRRHIDVRSAKAAELESTGVRTPTQETGRATIIIGPEMVLWCVCFRGVTSVRIVVSERLLAIRSRLGAQWKSYETQHHIAHHRNA